GIKAVPERLAPFRGVSRKVSIEPHEAAGDADLLLPVLHLAHGGGGGIGIAPEAGIDFEAAESAGPLRRIVARSAIVALQIDTIDLRAKLRLHAYPVTLVREGHEGYLETQTGEH